MSLPCSAMSLMLCKKKLRMESDAAVKAIEGSFTDKLKEEHAMLVEERLRIAAERAADMDAKDAAIRKLQEAMARTVLEFGNEKKLREAGDQALLDKTSEYKALQKKYESEKSLLKDKTAEYDAE